MKFWSLEFFGYRYILQYFSALTYWNLSDQGTYLLFSFFLNFLGNDEEASQTPTTPCCLHKTAVQALCSNEFCAEAARGGGVLPLWPDRGVQSGLKRAKAKIFEKYPQMVVSFYKNHQLDFQKEESLCIHDESLKFPLFDLSSFL